MDVVGAAWNAVLGGDAAGSSILPAEVQAVLASDAVTAVASSSSSSIAPPEVQALLASDAVTAVASKLREVGKALCAALPVSWCCNNPECTNMCGASELQLVGGKGSVCGGCRVAR
jgi:hypothetical protein